MPPLNAAGYRSPSELILQRAPSPRPVRSSVVVNSTLALYGITRHLRPPGLAEQLEQRAAVFVADLLGPDGAKVVVQPDLAFAAARRCDRDRRRSKAVAIFLLDRSITPRDIVRAAARAMDEIIGAVGRPVDGATLPSVALTLPSKSASRRSRTPRHYASHVVTLATAALRHDLTASTAELSAAIAPVAQ